MAVTNLVFVVVTILVVGCSAASAQEVPPPTPPVVTQPPATPTQPPATPPAATPAPEQPAVASAPALVKLTDAETRRRREAIFVMEGVFEKHVLLAAGATTSEIEAFQPGLKLSMFSSVPPQARGNYLEDYGVFFQVQIPSYVPSVVKVIEDLAERALARRPIPQSSDNARTVAMETPRPRDATLDPDAFYVRAVREYLMNAMVDQSKSLDLRPTEWLTVSARGDDGGPSELSQPSILMLRVKGSDLNDFLAGRLTRDEVLKRIEVKGTPGR
jgi:hypothetical protein